jgi:hypothetical protein
MCTEAKAPSDWASDYISSPNPNAMVSAPSAIDYPFEIVISFTVVFKRPLSWLIAVKNTPNLNGLGIRYRDVCCVVVGPVGFWLSLQPDMTTTPCKQHPRKRPHHAYTCISEGLTP